MTISLAEEVVVVTGGAKRLGRAIALQCAQSGASVAAPSSRASGTQTALAIAATVKGFCDGF